MIPEFDTNGLLPPGIHFTDWIEFATRFGGTESRQELLAGLRSAIDVLQLAGCRMVYIDGSYVTSKAFPGDYDACWDIEGVLPELLDPVLLDFSNVRQAQKAKFGGELFPAQLPEGRSGRTFLEFFQRDRATDLPKGIVALDLDNLE